MMDSSTQQHINQSKATINDSIKLEPDTTMDSKNNSYNNLDTLSRSIEVSMTSTSANDNSRSNSSSNQDTTKATTLATSTDIEYDLLLDEELNGFFDDDDTDNDEGGAVLTGTTSIQYVTGTHSQDDSNNGFAPTNVGQINASLITNAIIENGSTNNMNLVNSTVPQYNLQNQIRDNTSTTEPLKPSSSSSLLQQQQQSGSMGTSDDPIIDGIEPSLDWHNPTMHKSDRQSMIWLIGALLKARKKDNPTREWITQLPIKTRKLEKRLYHSASSLDEYKDRKTLKKRLLALARVIAVQHNENRTIENTAARFGGGNNDCKTRSSFGAYRNSATSVASASSFFTSSTNSNRPSFVSAYDNSHGRSNRFSATSTNSMDSLRELRESVDTKIAMLGSGGSTPLPLPTPTLPTQLQSKAGSDSVSSKRSNTGENDDDNSVGQKKWKDAITTDGFKMPAPRLRHTSFTTTAENSYATTGIMPLRNNPSKSRSHSSSTPPLPLNYDSSSSTVNPTIRSTQLLKSSSDISNDRTTALQEQTKSINERLQEQILENIRLQEEIVRKLQQADEQLSFSTGAMNSTHMSEEKRQLQQRMQQQQQQQQHNPSSVYNATNSIVSNAESIGLPNINFQPSTISSSLSAATNFMGSNLPKQDLTAPLTGMNMSQPNQLTSVALMQHQHQQQLHTSSNFNSNIASSSSQMQPQNFLPGSNIFGTGVDALRNQIFLQQQLQQKKDSSVSSFGGMGTIPIQQNDYNALLQLKQNQSPLALSDVQASLSSASSTGGNALWMAQQQSNMLTQQQQLLLQSLPNNATALSHLSPRQQQITMQMQLLQRQMPAADMSNTSTMQQQLSSLSEGSAMSSLSLPANTIGLQSAQQQPESLQQHQDQQNVSGANSINNNSDHSSFTPMDSFDWWK